MSDGSTLEFPLIEITGAKPGPALYLGGAIHGDEVNGVRIIGRIAQEIDPSRLRGRLFAVPIQNPLAFKTRSRYYPTEQGPAIKKQILGKRVVLIQHRLREYNINQTHSS